MSVPPRRRRAGTAGTVATAGAVLAVLAACTPAGRSGSAPPTAAGSGGRSAAVAAPPSGGSGPAATSSAPAGTGPTTPAADPTVPLPEPGPVTETAGACPYLDAATASDLEGNKVGRTTVLGSDPVGCVFYFAYGDGAAVLRIDTARYRSANAAYDAMVARGRAGGDVQPAANLAPGVDGVLYRTTFYPPDGDRDWACSFATGEVVVTVSTNQDDVSLNARRVAAAVAPRV